MPVAAAISQDWGCRASSYIQVYCFFRTDHLKVDIQRSLFYDSDGGLMPLRHMKSFACLLFLLPTLALAQDYLGQNHPRVRIYANGNDYISNVVGDILASRSRGETRIDRANNYARQQAYEDAVANLAALRAHQAATERAEINRLTRMENSRAEPLKPPSAEFLATQKRFESKP
jgi:hypothetical protein